MSDDFENDEYNLQRYARMMKFGKHESFKNFWTVRSPYGFDSRFSYKNMWGLGIIDSRATK